MTDDPGDTGLISISNRQEMPLDESTLIALASRCLEGEGAGDAELSISFVGEGEMAELHERFMGEPGPTDVLSFRMDEEATAGATRLLGDVVIAPAVAAQSNPDIQAEVRLLLVHGILHLLGHDHENEGDKSKMWARQELYVETRVP